MNPNNLLKISLIILLFTLICPVLSAQNNDSLDFNLVNRPLVDFFDFVERNTDFTFMYRTNEISVQKKITFSGNNVPLETVLDKILTPLEISYQITGKQIVLKKNDVKYYEQNLLEVKGTIYSLKDNTPLPGVNIIVKDSTYGTISDLDGNYLIQGLNKDDVLIFSFLGYRNKEIIIGNSQNINVWLLEDTKNIDEVIIVGYGEESKKLLSSSVSNIKSKDLSETFTNNISEALNGKLTGIIVNQNSGTPGAATTMRVRGISSITAGADPLYIIDGVPLLAKDLSQITFNGQGVNTFTDINIPEIESISVLKDASATAIYGARGSNGVILITTKRGKPNESDIEINARYGMQEVANYYEMLNSQQFMNYKNDAAINSGGIAIYSKETIENNTIDTDWQKELYRIAPIESYDLSFAGGSENTRYYIIGSYFNQEGIVEGTDYKRISSRINLDQTINKRLELGISFSINRSENNRKEGDQSLNGPVPNAISLPPIYPVYNKDGTFNEDGHLANPISISKQHTNIAYSWHNLGNAFLHFKIAENLTSKTKIGVDYINFREHTYDPASTRQGAKYHGLGLESTSEAIKTMISQLFEYSKKVNNTHYFNAIAGFENDREQLSSTFMRGESFASEKLEYLANAVEKVSAEAYFQEAVINSYFGRIKYNYRNKYIATVNARYDGSSRFSKTHRYGFFPSGDIAWRISEEDFFQSRNINELKIRSSYGITGNDNIPEFLYISQYGAAEYASEPVIYSLNIPNPSLKWETTKQFNLGIDLALFNERINLSIDYYKKKTEDLLLRNPIPPSSGYYEVISNIGKLENKGFEIYLHTKIINDKFRWNSELNISFNENKVTSLFKNKPIENIGRGFQRIEVGESIGIFYGYNSLGVDPSTGDLVFEDVNNDGKITVDDKKKIGCPHAKFQGGFLNTFSYGNFELNIFFQYSYGNNVFNGTRRYIESMKDANNQTTAILNRWTKPGDITDIPRATNADPNENNRVSSRFVEDGSYIKLKTLRLSYKFRNLGEKISETTSISLFLLGQNLYTITKYSGLDPEVNYAGADVIRSGVEFFTYPPAKILSIGMNVKF